MAHAIWSGAINFGLVTIPVKLQTAIRASEQLRFNFLHAKDEGRIKNMRVCSLDNKEVPWDQIVRGYEYEKGQYVVLNDEDFERVNPEKTQSVDILQFVDLDEINPMLFDRPYYLEPEKKGRHAYALLREALAAEKKVAIAKVVIRSKEHIAAVKPNDGALVLEIMHYADEIVDQSEYDFPEREKPAAGEMKVAKMLIDEMTEKFDPEKFKDTYKEEVMAMIEARAAGKEVPRPKARPAGGKVVNIMDALQRSLQQNKGGRGRRAAGEGEERPRRTTRRKRSAA